MIDEPTTTPPLTPDLWHPFAPQKGRPKRCKFCNRKRSNWIHYTYEEK